MEPVASPELCKELYELSGWEPSPGVESSDAHWPAYGLGYLLRKIVREYHDGYNGDSAHIGLTEDGKWEVVLNYGGVEARGHYFTHKRLVSGTPEDAACSHAIELFKQGVLQKNNLIGGK